MYRPGRSKTKVQNRCCQLACSPTDPILLRAARGERVERPPVWLMRQAGRYMAAFREYSNKYPFRHRSETAEIAIELSMQPWRAFKPDGVIMFSDILTPLPAMGIGFDVIKGKGPVIADPLRTQDQLKALKSIDDPASQLPFIQPILSTLRENVGNESTVVGFIGTPWTLAAYSIEGSADRHCKATKTLMLTQPGLLHDFLSHLATNLAKYVLHQIDSGAQVVQLFDSWAHHLSPAQFAEFSAPYAQRVIDEVKVQRPHVPLIFHANGGVGKLEQLAGVRADVIGLDWCTDMTEARQRLGSSTVLQGNVDPMILFGPQESIQQSVQECVRKAGRHHILNVGHGVVQGTPEDSVLVFCNAAKAAVYNETSIASVV